MCYHDLDIIAPEFIDKSDKNIVLLNSRDKYVRMLESELVKQGFKIKKFAFCQKWFRACQPDKKRVI